MPRTTTPRRRATDPTARSAYGRLPRERAAAVRVSPTRNELRVTLTTGAVYVVPLTYTTRLAGATPAQLRRYELDAFGIGIHWPAIDEDLSVAGIVRDGTRLDVPNGSTRRRSTR